MALVINVLYFFVFTEAPPDYMDYFEGSVNINKIFWLSLFSHLLPCLNDALIWIQRGSNSCCKNKDKDKKVTFGMPLASEWREYTRTIYMVLNIWLVLEVTYLF